jgi:hypothetical protein
MYEYRIVNRITEEETVIFGYTYADACKRAKLNPEDCELECVEYVD